VSASTTVAYPSASAAMKAPWTVAPGIVVSPELEVGGGAGVVDDGRREALVNRGADGRVDAHAAHHAGDDERVDPLRPELVGEAGPEKAVGRVLLDHGLALGGRDKGMDLDSVGARAHERGIGRVPDVLEVDDRLALGPEGVEQTARRLGGRVGPHEGIGPAWEVVALDVDDE
jgi:hypothetical protein